MKRRHLLASTVTASAVGWTTGAAQAALPSASKMPSAITGQAHWTNKRVNGQDIRLFMWHKKAVLPEGRTSALGTIVFVHGSSVSSTPVFDLQIPGRPESSVMDWFARLGYDSWCFDCEGYGRSDKSRPVNADIACGADDLAVVSDYIMKHNGQQPLLTYGSSSGALRAALFAQRHPERVARLALDAFVWTGEGSPTLANRRKRLSEWQGQLRRPIDYAMVESIFTRDHPGTADMDVVKAFADAILKLDTSVPTGTYLDMSARLPVCNPDKMNVPTMIMRGQFDGIAGFQDLLNYFAKLPNPDKRFVVMPGIAHSSLHEKNLAIVMSVLENFFGAPAPVYQG